MGKEYLHEEPKPRQGDFEEQKISADDLKFVRSVVEKTYRQVRPDTRVLIMWGLICTLVYIAVYLLVNLKLYKWSWPVYLFLIAIGICYTSVAVFQANKCEKKEGFVPHLPKQITWIWIVMTFHGLIWSMLGLFNDFFGGPGFLWALLLSFTLSVTGVLHSKEWLFGSIGIFAGMLLAFFIKDYAYIILGLATGAGLIIPAIIADRNYRKKEKSYE